MDVVALGELLIDFTENGTSAQDNKLFEANPGGAPCNVLAMLQKLGHQTAFIGKVGQDAFGRLLVDAVKVARAQGDLSENFEYKAAKQFKNQNESRIRYLEKMIKTAVVISDESKDDEVGMFNTVDVYFEDDDETETYKIVTTVRGNSLKNLISKESPLGAAIFGHKVGDRCEVKVNDDYSYFVKIMKIQNTVDDGSDDLRKF